ncbi:hypothetical protein ACFFMR_29045 [Micromonospora andamanensis]|uniref:Secreted protein/lipoprotein n=1 Tax=Micromonospora andamanensis TaxID=1287068 RepID=A0ABQ4I3Y9_9ACTN|nr:hypothetical protein [Micromonospora andamanensis]GIJ12617.1 hypothetical protein Van01_58310 [Micromonospora andamanensis]
MACLVGVSALLSTACSTNDDGESVPTTQATTPPSAPASEAPSAQQEALAAYIGMWQAMAKAGEVPDPDAPELRRYAADRALARVVDVLFTYRETGVVTRGAPVTDARVSGASPADAPTEVTVVDCGDSTNWTKHTKATGELIADDPRGRRNITAVVKPVDGSWKVVSFDVGDIGSC